MGFETGLDAADAWPVMKRNEKNIKALIPGMKAMLSAGDVWVERVFADVGIRIVDSMEQLTELAAVPNLDAYVQVVRGDPSYVATEHAASIIAAEQAVIDWLDEHASGLALTGDTFTNYISFRSANNKAVTGSIATNRFSANATSGLRTLLDAVVAAVDA